MSNQTVIPEVIPEVIPTELYEFSLEDQIKFLLSECDSKLKQISSHISRLPENSQSASDSWSATITIKLFRSRLPKISSMKQLIGYVKYINVTLENENCRGFFMLE